MREISFKFWDILEKKMLDDISSCTDDFTDLINEMFDYKQLADLILPLQYVGIRDKHGEKVHEGDILYHESSIPQPDGDLYNSIIGEVRVMNGMTYLIGRQTQIQGGKESVSDYKCLLLSPKLFHIIGNIYENPDLVDWKSPKNVTEPQITFNQTGKNSTFISHIDTLIIN